MENALYLFLSYISWFSCDLKKKKFPSLKKRIIRKQDKLDRSAETDRKSFLYLLSTFTAGLNTIVLFHMTVEPVMMLPVFRKPKIQPGHITHTHTHTHTHLPRSVHVPGWCPGVTHTHRHAHAGRFCLLILVFCPCWFWVILICVSMGRKVGLSHGASLSLSLSLCLMIRSLTVSINFST